jgi:hypothetical protein
VTLYVDKHNAELIEKLKRVFDDDESVELAVGRRVEERRRISRSIYIDQRKADRRGNRQGVDETAA